MKITHRIARLMAACVVAAALAIVAMVGLHAQQANVTVPVLYGNIAQWGGAALPAAAALNDAISNPTTGVLGSLNAGWNGTNWERVKTSALANFPLASTTTARNQTGAALVEKGSRWTVVSTPSVSAQASASITGESSVRHVADCVIFSAGSTSAPSLTQLTVNLRDGATGAGTVIASWTVVIPASTGQNVAPISFCGLGLVGTTNTAMTLEYSALLTNLFENVTLTGFNIT